MEISKRLFIVLYLQEQSSFLVSFPKTGRTWLSYMLDQIEDKSDKKINYLKTHDFSEIVIESGQKQIKFNLQICKRYFYRRAKVIFS